jgi:vacuole morphology and inheritance protein 14
LQVLECFDDPESRVRYYACESLYNIAKISRVGILRYFDQIFVGLCKLFADVDVDVKNGANLLDRLVKDIATVRTCTCTSSHYYLARTKPHEENCPIDVQFQESEVFDVDGFVTLLQKYIQATGSYCVGISFLEANFNPLQSKVGLV